MLCVVTLLPSYHMFDLDDNLSNLLLLAEVFEKVCSLMCIDMLKFVDFGKAIFELCFWFEQRM